MVINPTILWELFKSGSCRLGYVRLGGYIHDLMQATPIAKQYIMTVPGLCLPFYRAHGMSHWCRCHLGGVQLWSLALISRCPSDTVCVCIAFSLSLKRQVGSHMTASGSRQDIKTENPDIKVGPQSITNYSEISALIRF